MVVLCCIVVVTGFFFPPLYLDPRFRPLLLKLFVIYNYILLSIIIKKYIYIFFLKLFYFLKYCLKLLCNNIM